MNNVRQPLHDINNLLTSILGHAWLVESDSTASKESLAAAAAIRVAAQQAGLIARRFGGREVASAEAVDMHELMEDATAVIQGSLPKGVVIEKHTGASVHFVKGDRSALFQMLMNLMWNAAEAMPSGGIVGIDTEGNGPLRLTVSDCGHGMDPALIGKIFEESFTTKSIDTHSGLGLSIVKSVVEAHGGEIEVESHAGQGTQFRVTLPASGQAVKTP